MNNTLKYILLIIGFLVLVAAAALYLKPELLNTVSSGVFPARIANENTGVDDGAVVYTNDQDIDIAVTSANPASEFIEQDPVIILYQDTVAQDAEPVTFTGIYQEYNTGCFADGECSAVVDGKKITTILGWTQEEVGSFENPDIPFGTEVEVYALPTESGNYTLYGSEDYYIRQL